MFKRCSNWLKSGKTFTGLLQCEWFAYGFLVANVAFNAKLIVITLNTLLVSSNLEWPLGLDFDISVVAKFKVF